MSYSIPYSVTSSTSESQCYQGFRGCMSLF
nr:MAG TPA: hypothetical protein [Caudoviricetes sp.]DAS50992.1 MAG TPA: hypothetical protein [Caudoviricetes sp.]